MATYDIKNYQNLPDPGFGGVAYGNMTAFHFRFESNSAGVVTSSTLATAAQNGDIFKIGQLPAGFRPIQVIAHVSDQFTSSVTCDLGFLYADGVDVTAAAQDADHWFDAADLAAAVATLYGVPRGYTRLAKKANVVLTIEGAHLAAAGVVDFWIMGINDSV